MIDPRTLLARWANENDEWVRYVVREVLATGQVLHVDAINRDIPCFAACRRRSVLDLLVVDSEMCGESFKGELLTKLPGAVLVGEHTLDPVGL